MKASALLPAILLALLASTAPITQPPRGAGIS